MSRDWKLGAQVQMPDAPNTIELSQVTYNPGGTIVVGRVEWSEDAKLDVASLEVRIGFNGEQVRVRTRIGVTAWDAGPALRGFKVTTEPVPASATSIEVRIGRSSVIAALER